jgi:hypothetical protein
VNAARALLAGLVDYAGLFPPAALPMDEAVAEYAASRRSPEAWMLGRFVVPAGRLAELSRAADRHPGPGAGEPWRLSALLGTDVRGDTVRVTAFNESAGERAVVDAVELKAGSPQQAEAALEAVPPGLATFVEVPLEGALEPILAVLKAHGASAKVRTGGIVPEAIPGPAEVARFIAACAAAGVPWKATAGLHHPVRAEHALTYAGASPRAVMHGFLNVFAAAALARTGASPGDLEAVLREQDPSALCLGGDVLAWRHLSASADEVREARRAFATSFGSCSFAEPVAGLRSLGLLGGS